MPPTPLTGGNTATPILDSGRLYKPATAASPSVHRVLAAAAKRGVTAIPHPFGITEAGEQVLSFLPGVVPHDTPGWLWSDSVLRDAARFLRRWHDATTGFAADAGPWDFSAPPPHEVICHNDFAPYNAVFTNQRLSGVIDFDLCSPGSRIWDIAYSAYRFVPLMPEAGSGDFVEFSPFSRAQMRERLEQFLDSYAEEDRQRRVTIIEVIATLQVRLLRLAEWSESFSRESGRSELLNDARMYRLHREWLGSF